MESTAQETSKKETKTSDDVGTVLVESWQEWDESALIKAFTSDLQRYALAHSTRNNSTKTDKEEDNKESTIEGIDLMKEFWASAHGAYTQKHEKKSQHKREADKANETAQTAQTVQTEQSEEKELEFYDTPEGTQSDSDSETNPDMAPKPVSHPDSNNVSNLPSHSQTPTDRTERTDKNDKSDRTQEIETQNKNQMEPSFMPYQGQWNWSPARTGDYYDPSVSYYQNRREQSHGKHSKRSKHSKQTQSQNVNTNTNTNASHERENNESTQSSQNTRNTQSVYGTDVTEDQQTQRRRAYEYRSRDYENGEHLPLFLPQPESLDMGRETCKEKAFHHMLWAWYWTGYYAGLHDAGRNQTDKSS